MQTDRKRTILAAAIVAVLGTAAIILLRNGNEPVARPKPMPKATDIAMLVRQESKLYSAEQTAHKTVAFSTREVVSVLGYDITVPWSGTTATIPITATYKACVDLDKIGAGNVTVGADTSITVTLPDPVIEMTSCEIDHDSEVFDKQFFARPKSQEFINRKVSEAEQDIWSDVSVAQKDALLDSARRNAGKTIAAVLLRAGYTKVSVRYAPDMNAGRLKVDIVKD